MSVTLEEISAALDAAADARPVGRVPVLACRRPAARTREHAFHQWVLSVDGGHLHWTGQTEHGSPVLWFRSVRESVYRLAFRLHHGRAPHGQVRWSCDYQGCVAGEHLTDRVIRAQAAAGARP
ncbi:hypothetical protein ACPCSP_20245 [Streptomyces cinereoruber]|uniref:hypothetical protein n=1 Tax=Streptomyces cinereoruber TaxID=67260 RepID=UPI003C2F2568